MRRHVIPQLAAFVLTAPFAPAAAAAVDPDAPPEVLTSVVSVIDSGINPYHEEFRWDDEAAFEHPSTYLDGYPEDAIAVELSLDEPDYWTAVRKDCELWRSLENDQLYYFPGTRIIGGISFGVSDLIDCDEEEPPGGRVLDDHGHGTMTASRAAAASYGACGDCLVVAIQNPLSVNFLDPGSSAQPAIDSIRWAADNATWIDAQSNSWGPLVSGWEPTGMSGLVTSNPELVRAVEETAQAHLGFWASGNGAAFRGGVLGHPTVLSPHLTPSAISVGGMDSGQVNTWPGFPPHVVSDSCDSWAAEHRSTNASDEDVGGGTSAATPFVAGGAARILLAARAILDDTGTGVHDGVVAEGEPGLAASGPLADGVFTLAEWKEVVFKTATPRPERQHEDGAVCDSVLDAPYQTTPLQWSDVPEDAPAYVFIGYGAVDAPALGLAFEVLRGDQALPDRSAEDAYFAADHDTREMLFDVWGGP